MNRELQPLTKAARKRLRVLAEQAYERELSKELERLFKQFESWRRTEITCWELSNQIHRFHDGPSRQLYSMYNTVSPEMAVGRALANGLLAEEELPEELRSRLGGLVQFFREDLKNE